MESNKLQVFKNQEFGEVRSVVINNQPWMVGKDIVEALKYKDNYTHIIKQHCDKEDYILLSKTSHGDFAHEFNYKELGQRGGYLVNESGMYALVFGSDLPLAKKFKKWVTSEVLPSLRKTGTYSITTQQPNEMVANLVQSTMTAILPVITEQMAKVTIQNQQQINQMAGLMHDQSEIYDADRQEIKNLIGFRSVNTSRMVNTIKEKLSEKLGTKVMANHPKFLKVKKEIFKEYEVIKWEDIPVEKYSSVFAFVDTYIDENF